MPRLSGSLPLVSFELPKHLGVLPRVKLTVTPPPRSLPTARGPEREPIFSFSWQLPKSPCRWRGNTRRPAHLEGLLEQAKKLAPAPKALDTENEIQKAADELHAWLTDWTGQARAFITRGDYLIRLGLISRKNRTDDEDDEVFEDEVVPAPVGMPI